MSAADKCEVLPCVSLITWMWFSASTGLIWRAPPASTTMGARLFVPRRPFLRPFSSASSPGVAQRNSAPVMEMA
jgi:hypothetical protein